MARNGLVGLGGEGFSKRNTHHHEDFSTYESHMVILTLVVYPFGDSLNQNLDSRVLHLAKRICSYAQSVGQNLQEHDFYNHLVCHEVELSIVVNIGLSIGVRYFTIKLRGFAMGLIVKMKISCPLGRHILAHDLFLILNKISELFLS